MATIFICMTVTMVALGAYSTQAYVLTRFCRRVALAMLLVCIIGLPCLVIKSCVVPNATNVATIHATSRSDTKALFQENDTGRYFILEESPWNPWNASYRKYIDEEVAEEYVAKYNELKEIEIP